MFNTFDNSFFLNEEDKENEEEIMEIYGIFYSGIQEALEDMCEIIILGDNNSDTFFSIIKPKNKEDFSVIQNKKCSLDKLLQDTSLSYKILKTTNLSIYDKDKSKPISIDKEDNNKIFSINDLEKIKNLFDYEIKKEQPLSIFDYFFISEFNELIYNEKNEKINYPSEHFIDVSKLWDLEDYFNYNFEKDYVLNKKRKEREPLEFWLLEIGFLNLYQKEDNLIKFDMYEYSEILKNNQFLNFEKINSEKNSPLFSELYESFFEGLLEIDLDIEEFLLDSTILPYSGKSNLQITTATSFLERYRNYKTKNNSRKIY